MSIGVPHWQCGPCRLRGGPCRLRGRQEHRLIMAFASGPPHRDSRNLLVHEKLRDDPGQRPLLDVEEPVDQAGVAVNSVPSSQIR